MKITIAAVGRIKRGPEKNLWDIYAKRLKWPLVLREVEEKNTLRPQAIKSKEGDLLLAKVPNGAFLIAMDPNGLLLSSLDFAKKIDFWQDSGLHDLAIVVGGSEGLDQRVIDRADLIIAMGKMTWPHMLARIMLLEQIYRAQCILGNHPYHK